MSDFISSFWSGYVALLTLLSIGACALLLVVMSRARAKQAAPQGADGPGTTGHVWDGDLREYNNPLPKWWLNLFWITIFFGVAYLILFPGFGNMPGALGWTSAGAYSKERQEIDDKTRPLFETYLATDLKTLAANPEARAMGEIVKQGWRPKRTIIYAAWDGEEPGLLGSTEWAETHADELAKHAVAYLNSDTNGRGYLGIEGSHVLERFINGVARDITDPETGVSVERRLRARRMEGASAATRAELRSRRDLHIGALGSGSDYTSFLQHLGIPSVNLGFGGEDGGGVYHSIYDDFYWYTHFSDTSFVYGRALAQTAGTAVMRLADADVIPYDYTDLAETVQHYVSELQALASSEADEATARDADLRDSTYAITNDPRNPLLPPPAEAGVPHLEFAALQNAADSLTRAARRYDAVFAKAIQAGGPSFSAANAELLRSERLFISDAGLPNRSWFKHLLYAPGYYTGYGVKTIPGVREAIEQREWPLANHEIERVAAALNAEAALVDRVAGTLSH